MAAAKPRSSHSCSLGASAVAAASALLVLAVVGLPILFFGGGDSGVVGQPTTTVASTTVAPTTVPSATVPAPSAAPAEVVPFPASDLALLEVPLSEAIPGFSDTIVMSAWSVFGYGVMRWSSSEAMTELLLPRGRNGGGWPFGLDASGNWVSEIFDDDVLTVQALPTVPGEPSEREIVGHDVQNEAVLQAVWHDTEPGRLAWLECPNFLDGPTTLVTLNASDPSAVPIRVRTFDQGCAGNPWGQDESDDAKPSVTLERWGSTGVWVSKRVELWGFAVESVLVDADGTEIATVSDAQMIAMSPDGTSMWRGESEDPCFVLSPDGQQRSTVPGVTDEEFLYEASWSPDGTRLALFLDKHGGLSPGEEVLRTVDSVSGEVITELEPELLGWGNAAAWSTDNRFFLYSPDVEPSSSAHHPMSERAPDVGTSDRAATLVFYDTATNTTTMVPIAGAAEDIRVR